MLSAAHAGLLPATANAGPLTETFAGQWREAERAYRTLRFVRAHELMTPLLAEGVALDDQALRFNFNRSAAFIHCMAGDEEQARVYANQAFATGLPDFPESATYEQREALKRLADYWPDLADLTGQRKPFWYATESDFFDSAGNMVDWNGNGRLDEQWYVDIDGTTRPSGSVGVGDGFYRRYEALSVGYGWDGDYSGLQTGAGIVGDCALSVSALEVPRTLKMSSSRAPSVLLKCMQASRCVGRVELRRKSRPTGALLARADYSIQSERRDRVQLRITQAGRRLARQGGSMRSVVLLELGAGYDRNLRLCVTSPCPPFCETESGSLKVTSRKGLGCTAALDVARRWLDRAGISPINAPLRNGSVLRVGGYRCTYRDRSTTCRSNTKEVRFRVRIS
jgi:hypothetical protein